MDRPAESPRAHLGDLSLRIFEDNSLSIGRTPLVRLNRVTDGAKALVLGKIEGRNPAYSVKCRIGAAMVWDAEKTGVLTAGKELIEPTSGNTGIALAFVGAARGYRVTLTMPETMSVERRKVLQALGAKLVLTDGAEGMAGSIARAEEMVAQDPQRFVMLQQFKNPANPLIHFRTTGPEIWGDTEGSIDVLVSGIGTGFIPGTLDLAMVDRLETVTNEESIEMARRLAKQEGILAGISCGAAVVVAVRLAKEPAFEGKTIVTILPDAAERYLTSSLFEGMFDD